MLLLVYCNVLTIWHWHQHATNRCKVEMVSKKDPWIGGYFINRSKDLMSFQSMKYRFVVSYQKLRMGKDLKTHGMAISIEYVEKSIFLKDIYLWYYILCKVLGLQGLFPYYSFMFHSVLHVRFQVIIWLYVWYNPSINWFHCNSK